MRWKNRTIMGQDEVIKFVKENPDCTFKEISESLKPLSSSGIQRCLERLQLSGEIVFTKKEVKIVRKVKAFRATDEAQARH